MNAPDYRQLINNLVEPIQGENVLRRLWLFMIIFLSGGDSNE